MTIFIKNKENMNCDGLRGGHHGGRSRGDTPARTRASMLSTCNLMYEAIHMRCVSFI